MNIDKKLEEIRQKPEHIRIRYVWAAVAISMAFIILVWLFSFGRGFKSTPQDKSVLPDFKSSLESQQQNLESINNLMKSQLENSAGGEGTTNDNSNGNNIQSSASPPNTNNSNSNTGQ